GNDPDVFVDKGLGRHCGIRRRRADDLIAIADGRVTLAEIREKNRERVTAHRERKKAEVALRHAEPDISTNPNKDVALRNATSARGPDGFRAKAVHKRLSIAAMTKMADTFDLKLPNRPEGLGKDEDNLLKSLTAKKELVRP